MLSTAFLPACRERRPVPVAAPARAVTAIPLEPRSFPRELRLTGSVTPYRQEAVGFEVRGRVLAVADPGIEVSGPAFDADDRVVTEGEPLARLDDERYRSRYEALRARHRALEKQRDALRIDAEGIGASNLAAARARESAVASSIEAARREIDGAEASLELARQTHERKRGLAQTSISRQEVDEARSMLDRAIAERARAAAALAATEQELLAQRAAVAMADASMALKGAELEASEARIVAVSEELREAERDLRDCVLRAPFSGRVTTLHVAQGAVVEAGQPIVTLSLMDPVQIRVTVSADEERRIRTGDRVRVEPREPVAPDGPPAVMHALVFEKGAVADERTRTFRIDLMTRNERRPIDRFDSETTGLPVLRDLLPVIRRYRGEEGPLYVPVDAVLIDDAGRTSVLRLPGVGFAADARRTAVGRHTPEEVPVSLGDDAYTVIKWNFRSLSDAGALREDDFVLLHPREEYRDGVAIGRPQWLLRPGDLVPVFFLREQTSQGLWVPVEAVTTHGHETVVFTVEEGRARRRAVTVVETYREFRRVEGPGLTSGVPLVVDGVAFLSDGERVALRPPTGATE